MRSNFFMIFRYFFTYFKKFFLSVLWYENIKFKKIKNKNRSNNKFKLIVLKSRHNISRLHLNEYFDKHKSKSKRLNKKNYFLALVKKKIILSSGWIYFGSKWKITDIDLDINIRKQGLLYDFETPKDFRNRGYYKILLKLIINKFKNRNLAIYSLSSNFKSIRAIEKSGFKFVKKIYGF